MKKMSRPVLWLLLILSLAVSFSVPVEAGPPYVGTWLRTARYVNGVPKGNAPATLVLTETSYTSITPAPPEEACAFTGSMTVHDGVMKVIVRVSACPETVPEGMVRDYRYSLTPGGDTLMTTTTIDGTAVKQVYQKKGTGKGGIGTRGRPPCSHPLCGTWNRTATYVNGAIVNATPAYTVITEKTYYSIAPACYNTLTIDSFHDNSFTLTMVSHNCPTGGAVMGPGTVVQQTFTLSNGGNTLTIINTEYGGEVKTVFQRLR